MLEREIVLLILLQVHTNWEWCVLSVYLCSLYQSGFDEGEALFLRAVEREQSFFHLF